MAGLAATFLSGDAKPSDLVLDHLVIGAASLQDGAAYLRDALGVEIPFGGQHPRMGTHNLLTRIGDNIFLEIIAIDPSAPAPARPRWFGLDDPAQQRRLVERPRPIAWLAGTRDIHGTLARTDGRLGVAVEMTRGALTWLISVRPEGAQGEGVLPSLIEWPEGPHPATRMHDCGIRYEALRIGHPEHARITAGLAAIDAADLVEVESSAEPALRFDLRSPDGGRVTLA